MTRNEIYSKFIQVYVKTSRFRARSASNFTRARVAFVKFHEIAHFKCSFQSENKQLYQFIQFVLNASPVHFTALLDLNVADEIHLSCMAIHKRSHSPWPYRFNVMLKCGTTHITQS